MKVLQINVVYEKYSTGRTTRELHEYLQKLNIESYVACPDLGNLENGGYKIGNKLDHNIHAILSRISGKQGYFSKRATKGLLNYMDSIKPDVVILRNLHGNYINLPMLLDYLAIKKIPVIVVLHDCWLFTGKCMYYVEKKCNKWMNECNNCPSLKEGNYSLFFDKSNKMFKDKKFLFSKINKLAVIGVSQWVTEEAKKSLLKNAQIIKCIYNWIDLNKFKPQDTYELRKQMGLLDKFIILGIATNWNENKGINVINDLANDLQDDCQIILIGNEDTVKNKNAKIIYLGLINDTSQLSKLYSMADVYLNPSIFETFGKTTAEALSCGTPVVAYNGTATPELVGMNGSCGYLINTSNAKDYEKKLMEIKKLGKKHYSSNCRSRAEYLFSKEKNVHEYIKIMHSLTNCGE